MHQLLIVDDVAQDRDNNLQTIFFDNDRLECEAPASGLYICMPWFGTVVRWALGGGTIQCRDAILLPEKGQRCLSELD